MFTFRARREHHRGLQTGQAGEQPSGVRKASLRRHSRPLTSATIIHPESAVLARARRGVDWWYWPCARTPAETPKAVDVRVARETMEPRQTEFKCCRASTCARGPMTASADWRRDLADLTHSRSVKASNAGGECSSLLLPARYLRIFTARAATRRTVIADSVDSAAIPARRSQSLSRTRSSNDQIPPGEAIALARAKSTTNSFARAVEMRRPTPSSELVEPSLRPSHEVDD